MKRRHRSFLDLIAHYVSFASLLLSNRSFSFSHLTGHCPSGDDPKTAIDETDCFNKTAHNSYLPGKVDNKCHVDCSNQGVCDYSTGVCKCFKGHWGLNCGLSNQISRKLYSQEGIYFNDVVVEPIEEDHFFPQEEEEFTEGYVAGVEEGY